MEVTQSVHVEADADHVWTILDADFGDVSAWAARMLESTDDPTLGPLGGRQVVTVEYGPAAETLYARDTDRRMLGYWVTGPDLPAPISDVQTEWRVIGTDAGSSEVSIRFLAVVDPPEMQPMLEATLQSGMAPYLDELRHFAETGEAHPNKAAA